MSVGLMRRSRLARGEPGATIALLLSAAVAAAALPDSGLSATRYWLRIEAQTAHDSLRPTAIAVDPVGRTYVCEGTTNRLLLLDESYRVVRWTGGFGWEKEQFDGPADLCARNGLDVFVCDYNNHRIQRFDKDLNFIAWLVGPELAEPWRFTYPVSVDQGAQGDLFVLQRDPPRVIRFDALGQPRLTFGELESGPGKLVDPVRLEVGNDDRIYVLDHGDRTIKVFDFFGNYAATLGGRSLRKPTSLAWVGPWRVLVWDEEAGLLVVSPGGPERVAVVPALSGPIVDLAANGRSVTLLLQTKHYEIWRGRLEVTQLEESGR